MANRDSDGKFTKGAKTYLEKYRELAAEYGWKDGEFDESFQKSLPTPPKMTRSSSSGYRSVFRVNGVEITLQSNHSKDSKRETERLIAFYNHHLAEFGNDIILVDDINQAKNYIRKFSDLRFNMKMFMSAWDEAERTYSKVRKSYKELMVLLNCEPEEAEAEEEKDKAVADSPCQLYFISDTDHDVVKIGISKSAEKRIKDLQTSNGFPLELTNCVTFPSRKLALEAEAYLHNKFSWARIRPIATASCEWFQGSVIDDLMSNFNTAKKIEESIKKERVEKAIMMKKAEEMSQRVQEYYNKLAEQTTTA